MGELSLFAAHFNILTNAIRRSQDRVFLAQLILLVIYPSTSAACRCRSIVRFCQRLLVFEGALVHWQEDALAITNKREISCSGPGEEGITVAQASPMVPGGIRDKTKKCQFAGSSLTRRAFVWIRVKVTDLVG